MPSKAPQGNFESIVESFGRVDTRIGGRLYSFLRSPLGVTDTTITVDSTHEFPQTGTLLIGTEKISYTKTSPTTFTCTDRAADAVTKVRGTPVYDASRSYSESDSVRSKTYIDTADGIYLTRALRNYGLDAIDGVDDQQNRDFGKYASFPVAGRLRTVVEGLGKVLLGQMRTADINAGAGTLTLTGTFGGVASVWPLVNGRLVRVLAPAKSAGLYRIQEVGTGGNPAAAKFVQAAGTYWDSGSQVQTESVAIEILRFDVWEHPLHETTTLGVTSAVPTNERCRFHIDILKFGGASTIKGAAFIQAGELATSSAATTVTSKYTPTQVLAVWLASDVGRTGTNYFAGGGFVGTTITLGVALPAAVTPVIIDYGAAQFTAQVMSDASVSGDIPLNYFPFYLSQSGTAIAQHIVDVIRAAGQLPTITEYIV